MRPTWELCARYWHCKVSLLTEQGAEATIQRRVVRGANDRVNVRRCFDVTGVQVARRLFNTDQLGYRRVRDW